MSRSSNSAEFTDQSVLTADLSSPKPALYIPPYMATEPIENELSNVVISNGAVEITKKSYVHAQ
jgi:hypothetical protein